MNRIPRFCLYRFFSLLISVVLFNAVSVSAKRDIYVKTVSGGDYKVGFDGGAFGNDNTAWSLSFQFSEYGVVGRFLVISNGTIPKRDKNKIVITFNTQSPVKTLTIPCDKYDGFGFNFALKSGIIKPIRLDYMNTPINEIEANNMAAFIAFNISSIKINGLLLPGPYPSTQDFLKLFDAGVGKFPQSSYYAKYRADRSGKSRTQKRSSAKPASGNKTIQPSTPKPAKPASSPQSLNYGYYKYNGYTWVWNDYYDYGKSHDNQNGKLTIKLSPYHYIDIEHNDNITILTPDRKNTTRWTTRKGAIKANLVKGLKIEKTDDIIMYEKGDSQDSIREVVSFIWKPSENRFYCIRNLQRRLWNGRIINNIYYFRSSDSSIWPQIKQELLQELPFCGSRID